MALTKEEKNINAKKYYQINKKLVLERCLKYNTNHRNERHEYYKQYALKNVLRLRIQRRIWFLLKNKPRFFTDEQLLGCSWEEYNVYFEKLFTPGMSWNQIRNIHIDHIMPINSFNLNIKEDQLNAFNYKNTRPEWASFNLVKGYSLECSLSHAYKEITNLKQEIKQLKGDY